MSNLGMHTLYSLLNSKDEIVAERFFVSKSSLSTSTLRSVETNHPAKDFDLLLFSISFETDYINCVKFLHKADFEIYSTKRSANTPLVLAGGVATFINPEPLAPFVDGFLLGEFEPILDSFLEQIPFLADSAVKKEKKLQELAQKITGFYVPSAYKVQYDKNGVYKAHIPKQENFPKRITPAKLTSQPETAPHSAILTDHAVFPNTFLIELTRGCGMGCRFCAAGFVYRPPRAWSFTSIKNSLKKADNAPKIGLIGLEYGKRIDIEKIATLLLERNKKLGFSSLRADLITPSFAKLLKESGTKVATIAPEAGSQRMRDIINKNLTETDILTAIERLAEQGIPNFKLYFMIGLPFETNEDVMEIAALTKKIHAVMLSYAKARGKIGTISISLNQFIPKPWTPFQWSEFQTKKEIKHKLNQLKKSLKAIPNLKISLPSYRKSLLQALISRGDQKIAKLIETMAVKDLSLQQALKQTGLNSEPYLTQRPVEMPLPWEIVNHIVKKEYLIHEWRKAARESLTKPCEIGKCMRCNACAI